MPETPFSSQARDRRLQARKTLEEATLPVQTDSLSQRGIRKLRIVSESRFAELVGKLVESGKLSLPAGSGDAERAHEAWTRIRRASLDRLERLEAVATRLRESLTSLDLVLRAVEARAPRPLGRTRPADPHEARRAMLLREMLRDDAAV